METPKIRKANSSDVKDIIRLLVELAVYEKEPDAVKVTEEELNKPTSPYFSIRDIILGSNDFIKKQYEGKKPLFFLDEWMSPKT